jgi:predicted hydrolase (HD superfamily)
MLLSEARTLLGEMTQNVSLLRHMRTVELVMEAYAEKLGEPTETWAITGLLHDADYEFHPDKHPNVIVDKLRSQGEELIAHAISAHYTHWGVPYNTQLDKYLLACDELTGFVVACCQVRPDGITTLEPRSVIKKLKDKGFAAKVDRQEIQKGLELIAVAMEEHVQFIIEVLKRNREELGI